MPELKNSDIIKGVLKALFEVTGRRTTQKFAAAVIGAILRTLEKRYDFLGNVYIFSERDLQDIIYVASDINYVDPIRVGRAIETIIQVVYMDLKENAGLYFISEIKKNTGEEIITYLKDVGVDLELLQLQQRYLYRRKERNGKSKSDNKGISQQALDNVSLLGYSMKNVGSWNYDAKKKVCVIYGKNGKRLDQLNLDSIIKKYIADLTIDGTIETSSEFIDKDDEEKVELSEKELGLLRMLHNRDMDIETAVNLLNISNKDLYYMIHRLVNLEMLQYISSDEVELTEIGIAYIRADEKKKADVKE
jgi:hypothetical protein